MEKHRKSLDGIFRPESVAVVGASDKPGNIGREIVHNLIEFEFQGPVFPVNPRLRTLHSLKVYRSVQDIPDPVDLAIIVVPKEAVIDVVRSCGEKGVRGLVIITAGFKEVGGAGIEREARLEELIRKYGMRMVGPNCMGVINTDPAVRLDGSFARTMPVPGNIGFMSQSGALGEAILGIAARKGIGFSMFVSVGNKTDVSGNDLLLYWEHDAATAVILLYLESFGNPGRFSEIARRISRTKPILAVKAGRTSAGARAVSSHTGAMAGRDLFTDLLFEQCGVVRASSMEELFELAPAFALQPPPAGPRVAIVTNAGGPGILATDACVGLGLSVDSLSESTRSFLRQRLPVDASVENPIDLLASASPDLYRLAVRSALDDPAVDSLIVIFVPPVMTRSEEVARAICEESIGSAKPVLVCFMGADEGVPGVMELRQHRLPVYVFPESAAKALSALHEWKTWRDKPEGRPVAVDLDEERIGNVLGKVAAEKRPWLTGPEAREVLGAAGVPMARGIHAISVEEVLAAAATLGYPVALKRDGDTGEHKTESGGVLLNLADDEAVRSAFKALGRGPCLVQEMIAGGREMILGSLVDPEAGHLVMAGLGGIYVEILKDVAFRIAPLTDVDAADMVRSLKSWPLLSGFRGQPPADVAALESVLLRISALVVAFPVIAEIDINPFLVMPNPGDSRAVDARIRISLPD